MDSMLYRAYMLASSKNIQHKQLQEAIWLLRLNNYPPQKIKGRAIRLLNKKDICQLGNKDNNEQGKYKYTISIPYVGGANCTLRRILGKCGIRITEKPINKVSHFLTKKKDKVDVMSIKHTIYQIDCKNYPSSYIGQSKRVLGERVGEHRKAFEKELEDKSASHRKKCKTLAAKDKGQSKIIMGNKTNRHQKVLDESECKSAFYQHIKENPTHQIEFEKAEIIDIEPNYCKKYIKEGYYIEQSGAEAINRKHEANLISNALKLL